MYNPHDLSLASVSSFSVGVTSGYVIFLPNTLNKSSFSEGYPGIVSHQYQPTSEHWLSLSLYIYNDTKEYFVAPVRMNGASTPNNPT